MTFILFKVTMRSHAAWPAMAALNQRLELNFSFLQDEAVPGLVAGLNFIARYDLGDC